MKFDTEVKNENIKIAVGCLVCTVITMLVFVAIGYFDYTVLIGGVVGWLVAVGNFFFMSVGVVNALETGDETAAKLKLRNSYIIRTLAVVVIIALSFYLDFVNVIPIAVSIFYPRIVITVCSVWKTYIKKDTAEAERSKESADNVSENSESDSDSDEFEKFVSGFSRGVIPGENTDKNNDK